MQFMAECRSEKVPDRSWQNCVTQLGSPREAAPLGKRARDWRAANMATIRPHHSPAIQGSRAILVVWAA
jgi:hypothetical protein